MVGEPPAESRARGPTDVPIRQLLPVLARAAGPGRWAGGPLPSRYGPVVLRCAGWVPSVAVIVVLPPPRFTVSVI